MQPHKLATVRVYAVPGQSRSRLLYLSIQVWAPDDIPRRPFDVQSNTANVHEVASNTRTVFVNSFPVCVPDAGYARVTITASGSSTIPEDLSSVPGSSGPRQGSIYLADLSVSNTLGPACNDPQAASG